MTLARAAISRKQRKRIRQPSARGSDDVAGGSQSRVQGQGHSEQRAYALSTFNIDSPLMFRYDLVRYRQAQSCPFRLCGIVEVEDLGKVLFGNSNTPILHAEVDMLVVASIR